MNERRPFQYIITGKCNIFIMYHYTYLKLTLFIIDITMILSKKLIKRLLDRQFLLVCYVIMTYIAIYYNYISANSIFSKGQNYRLGICLTIMGVALLKLNW